MKPVCMSRALQISWLVFLASLLGNLKPVFSQNNIIPDDTLGDKSSVVNVRDENSDKIDGGATRGSNLFHSFQEFNVGEGRGVYFSNSDGINNVFSRVTGSNASNILGTLGVDGAANLYLINPNGIIFGANSSLDVQGSFTATTAHGVRFGEQGTFDALNPQPPQLLTINPTAYFFNQLESQNISSIQSQGTLVVPEGNNLTLIGGDIELTESILFASGGLIELGSLNDTGEVTINDEGNLTFSENITRGDISLSNSSLFSVGSGGGFININAQNLELLENSQIIAGIGEGLGRADTVAGDITLNLTDKLSLENSDITSIIFGEAQGTGGDVRVFANSVELNNGGTIGSFIFPFGQGDAGNIKIVATDSITIDGDLTEINSSVASEVEGNAGDIKLTTDSLTLTNGGKINSGNLGLGNGGSITIDASNSIVFDGISSRGLGSGVFILIAEGNSGGVSLTSKFLSLTNGGTISFLNLAPGNTGLITINATDSIILDGETVFLFEEDNIELPVISRIESSVSSESDGNVGDITLTTGSLSITNGATINTNNFSRGNAGSITINATDSITLDGGSVIPEFGSSISSLIGINGEGNAGDITLNTGSLTVTGGAEIKASTLGKGNGGSITINATDSVIFDGESDIFERYSSASSAVFEVAEGDAGDISIVTASLQLLNGGNLDASNDGVGNGGSITINATDSVIFDGESRDNMFSSGVFSAVGERAEGDAGDIFIVTTSLQLLNGATINSLTLSKGNSGSITINTSDSVIFDGEIIVINSVGEKAQGEGKDISITTDFLSLNNASSLIASTLGQGNSGDIIINANSLRLGKDVTITSLSNSTFEAGDITFNLANSLEVNDSRISSQAEQSSGGNLTIIADKIELRGDSLIRTDVNSGSGGGGNILLKADSIIAFDESDIISDSVEGRGGNIILDTPAFFGENFTLNSLTETDTSKLRDNNRVDINATGAVSGFVSLPDVSFIQNSLTEISNNAIDTDKLVANSCVVPNRKQKGTFIITGKGGLAATPDDELIAPYSTGEVQTIESDRNSQWQPGDPIIEPQGVYRLNNGKLILSRECSRS